MSEDSDRAGNRPSPMEYDGGMRLDGDPDPSNLAGWKGHPALYCPAPRVSGSFTGWYRCPACAKRTRLYRDPPAGAWARDAADTILAAVGRALVFPFRRQQNELEEDEAMEADLLCVACVVREDHAEPADYVIDGMSVCAGHAEPMITVLADRARA